MSAAFEERGNDYGLDDGSPEAEEAMFTRGIAVMRTERPWMFTEDDDNRRPGVDRRAFGRDEADNPTREVEPESIRWPA